MRTLKQEYFDKLENYINDYQQKQGYSPSISDMVRDLGIPQTTVYRYITHTLLCQIPFFLFIILPFLFTCFNEEVPPCPQNFSLSPSCMTIR